MPPAEDVLGLDLRHYSFREGQTYEVGRRLGEILIACGYAEAESQDESSRAADKFRR